MSHAWQARLRVKLWQVHFPSVYIYILYIIGVRILYIYYECDRLWGSVKRIHKGVPWDMAKFHIPILGQT